MPPPQFFRPKSSSAVVVPAGVVQPTNRETGPVLPGQAKELARGQGFVDEVPLRELAAQLDRA